MQLPDVKSRQASQRSVGGKRAAVPFLDTEKWLADVEGSAEPTELDTAYELDFVSVDDRLSEDVLEIRRQKEAGQRRLERALDEAGEVRSRIEQGRGKLLRSDVRWHKGRRRHSSCPSPCLLRAIPFQNPPNRP